MRKYNTVVVMMGLFWLLAVSCSSSKSAQTEGCPSEEADQAVTAGDKDQKALPDTKPPKDTDLSDADVTGSDTLMADEAEPGDELVMPEEDAAADLEGYVPDADLPPLCFEKSCTSHDDCSVKKEACTPYVPAEEYICGPDIELYGYLGKGQCLEIACTTDADCREDLGYSCIHLETQLPEFNNAESVCVRSITGEPCTTEGTKLCQYGKEIALRCTGGIWTPYYCEAGFTCVEGNCIQQAADSDAEQPDSDAQPPVEICDNVDNNGNNQIDEGCDDDADGWCDISMTVYGNPTVCPKGLLDCNDSNANIYPGSKIHQEGLDYDCDNRKEYQAVLVLSVDDQLVDLCVNGAMVLPHGTNYANWTLSDVYSGSQLVLESGVNVIGVHGIDTGSVISAFIATVQVNGQIYVSDGVMPPSNGVAYTPASPEWDDTAWRYFPAVQSGPNGDWCDKWFDDSTWGPAIRAGKSGETPVNEWGYLGAKPWNTTSCGSAKCPGDFLPYYQDGITGNEPLWIWDYKPTNLADAWLRRKIILP